MVRKELESKKAWKKSIKHIICPGVDQEEVGHGKQSNVDGKTVPV